ncbi:hypothetical protein LXL04_013638 [Taraxacum kok-saghyz]
MYRYRMCRSILDTLALVVYFSVVLGFSGEVRPPPVSLSMVAGGGGLVSHGVLRGTLLLPPPLSLDDQTEVGSLPLIVMYLYACISTQQEINHLKLDSVDGEIEMALWTAILNNIHQISFREQEKDVKMPPLTPSPAKENPTDPSLYSDLTKSRRSLLAQRHKLGCRKWREAAPPWNLEDVSSLLLLPFVTSQFCSCPHSKIPTLDAPDSVKKGWSALKL